MTLSQEKNEMGRNHSEEAQTLNLIDKDFIDLNMLKMLKKTINK